MAVTLLALRISSRRELAIWANTEGRPSRILPAAEMHLCAIKQPLFSGDVAHVGILK